MSNHTKTLADEPKGKKASEGPDTAYHRAKQYCDDKLVHAAAQTANWRLAFWGMFAICVICLVGWISSIFRPPLPPYIVEVNHVSGEANTVGRLSVSQYVPQQAEIKYFLSKFLSMVRAVPTDPVVIKRNWQNAYRFTRPAAATQLNEWAQRPDSPMSKIGQESVSIEVISINHVDDSQSFQARWKETTYTDSGAIKDTATWSGVFTIEIEQPTDEQTLLINPLGIYFKNFQWSKEAQDTGGGGHQINR